MLCYEKPESFSCPHVEPFDFTDQSLKEKILLNEIDERLMLIFLARCANIDRSSTVHRTRLNVTQTHDADP